MTFTIHRPGQHKRRRGAAVFNRRLKTGYSERSRRRTTISRREAPIVIAPSSRPVYDVWTRTRSNGGGGVFGRSSHFGEAYRPFNSFLGAVDDPLDDAFFPER